MVSDEGERRQLVGDGLRRRGRRTREELRRQQVVVVDEEPGQPLDPGQKPPIVPGPKAVGTNSLEQRPVL